MQFLANAFFSRSQKLHKAGTLCSLVELVCNGIKLGVNPPKIIRVLIPKLKLQFWNLSSAHSTGTHNYTCSVSRTHQAALVLAIKRSTTDALTIISDVIKVKAFQCFLPTGDFFSYFKGIIASCKES